MYYVHLIIHYDHWHFKFTEYNEEIKSLLEEVFDNDGLTIQMVVKGVLIECNYLSEPSELNTYLAHYEEKCLDGLIEDEDYYGKRLDEIYRLRSLLKINIK